MKTLNFLTTGNEGWLFEYIFPVGHDISQEHITNLRESCPEIKLSAAAMTRLAIDNMDNVILAPTDYVRVLDKADKGTMESRNWPDPESKHSVRLSDEQFMALEAIANRHFVRSKTTAVIWAITNFNWLLSRNSKLAQQAKSQVNSRMARKDTGTVTLRLPLALLNDRRAEAAKRNITLGRLLREELIALWEGTKLESPSQDDDFDLDLDDV
jgi:hypothetical protein